MKKLLFLFFALSGFQIHNAQTLNEQWATGYAGTGENSDKFNALIRDNAGNIYACGYTWKQGNGKDILLVKFNSSGDTVWTKTVDGIGNGNDELNDLAFDNAGNIVAVGTAKTSTGKDIAILKCNTSGVLQWVVTYNNALNLDDYGVKVAADNLGNIYAGGYGHNANLNNDYIVVKYSSAGTQLNIASFNGADNLDDELADMAIDASANVIVTGKSKTSSNKDDYATIKYNSSLVQQWFKTVDQAGKNDRATGIWVDANGNAYVTGRSSNGNDYDYLTIKYLSANGNTGWAQPKLYDSNGDDIAADITGNANQVVVAGTKFNGIQTDLQTIAYNPSTGSQLWSTAYANANGKDETANHITIGTNDEVVITGSTNVSTNATSNTDLLILKYNNTGVQQYAKIISGNSNQNEEGTASITDGSGNIYTVGDLVTNNSMKDAVVIEHNSVGVLQFNKAYNGEGEFTDKSVAICSSGGFIYSTGYTYAYGEDRNFCTIKYDAGGNKVWVRTFNGPDSDTDEPVDIAADGSGNIYVAGRSKNANNNYDLFIIKYNANGDTLWTRNWDGGNNGDDEAKDMTVDGSGNVYVTGISDGDASLLVNNDYITVKYSSAGTLLWAVPYNGNGGGDDKAYSIVLDNSGNAYVTGKTWNGADYDIQTQKYASANGAETAFATYASNLGDDVPAKIKLDNNGNVLIGAISDRDASASTDRDCLLVQYSSSGAQQWVQSYNGAGTGDDDLYDIAIDANNNIYVTGSSDLDSTAADNLDYVTLKYNSAGAKQWGKNYNGTANGDDVANAISFDASGNIYVTGQANEGTASSKNNNATTVVYSTNGDELDTISYDGVLNATDAGAAVLVDGGSVYVAGYGSYTQNNQKDFLTIKYNLTTSINEIDNNNSLIVFPNPCSSNSFLFIRNSHEGVLKIHNALGETVCSRNVSDNFDLSTTNWAAGIYFVHFQQGNSLSVVKLIIQ